MNDLSLAREKPGSGTRRPHARPVAWTGWMLALAVLAPMALLAASAWHAWDAAWRAAEAEVSRTADAAAQYARRLLEAQALRIARTNDLLAGLSDADIRARERELHEALREIAAEREPQDREAFYIFVYDRGAVPLVTSNLFPAPPPRPELAVREFNQVLRGPDAPWAHVSPVYVGQATGRAYFAVTRRRERTGNGLPPGEYDGVVNASLYLDHVNPTLVALAARPADAVSLVRSDGAILARSAGFGALDGESPHLPASSPMVAVMARGEEHAMVRAASSLDGIGRVAAIRRVGGDWPIYASAARERSAVVAEWRRTMLPQAGLAAGSTLLLLCLSLAVLRRERELTGANALLEGRVAERTEALSRSEAKLRRAQEAAGAIAFEVTPDGRVVDVPAALRELYGLPAGAPFDYATVLARIHPLDRERFEADHRRLARTGGPFRTEFRIRLEDGTVRWILTSGEAVPALPGARFPSTMVGVNIDITERKAAEEALRDNERFLELAQQAAGVASWSWDPDSGRVHWSRSMFELLGLDPEDRQASYDGFMAMVHPEDRDRLTAALQEGLRDGAFTLEFRVYRPQPDGGREERWLLCRARLYAGEDGSRTLIGIDIDITERRRAEQQFEAATAAMNGFVYEWDVPSGEVRRTGGVAALLGEAVPPEADAWISRIHPEDLPGVTAGVEAAFGDPARDSYELEYRVRRADGGWAWVWDRARVFRGPADGKAMRVVGGAVDATARRLAEERQALLLREVDHRAKNALAVVKAALRLTAEAEPKAFRAAIEGRIDALARAQALLAETNWRGSSLRVLLEGALAPFADLPSGPRILLDGPPVNLSGAVTQSLSMAVHELATNAMKYGALSSPAGTLGVTWLIEDEEVRLTWREAGGPRVTGPPGRKGFGSRVVDATVRTQLGGRVVWRWEETGLVVDLAFPVGRALAQDDGGSGLEG